MVEAILLHGKVAIAGYDERVQRYSLRCNKFAPSRKVLVGLNAMILLFGKASVLLVITTSSYLCTNDHSGR